MQLRLRTLRTQFAQVDLRALLNNLGVAESSQYVLAIRKAVFKKLAKLLKLKVVECLPTILFLVHFLEQNIKVLLRLGI